MVLTGVRLDVDENQSQIQRCDVRVAAKRSSDCRGMRLAGWLRPLLMLTVRVGQLKKTGCVC
jgi:hypothetical protein